MLREKRQPLSREGQQILKDTVARGTASWASPLRLDLRRITPSEGHELYRLVDASLSGFGFDLGKLGRKERRRCEELLERAGGLAEGHFEQQRELASLSADAAAILTEMQRPPKRPRYEQPGAVVLDKLWVHDWLVADEPILLTDHILLLVIVLASLESGRPMAPKARIEGVGDSSVLVLDPSWGPLKAPADPEGRLGDWLASAEHLAANDLLSLQRDGREIRLGRGARVLEVAQARKA